MGGKVAVRKIRTTKVTKKRVKLWIRDVEMPSIMRSKGERVKLLSKETRFNLYLY